MADASFFSGISAGIGDIFGGIGDLSEAAAYGQAAKIAQQNATLSVESGAIQQLQASRKIYQTVSAQGAQVAGAGLKQAGSAGDLYRASVSQGALTKQLIGLQTGINANSFQQEAAAYKGMQGAAQASGIGGILGGIVQGIGAFAMLSDDDAKEDIVYVGPSSQRGVNLYLYRYKGSPTIFQGVLASEVLLARPDCVKVDPKSGFKRVDYAALGVELKEVA